MMTLLCAVSMYDVAISTPVMTTSTTAISTY